MLSKYEGFYKGKRATVEARTLIEARDMFVAMWKVRRAYDIAVVLAEKQGQSVPVSPASL